MKRRRDLILGSALLVALFGCGGGSGPSMVRVSDVKVKSKSSSCQLSIFEKEADVKQATEKLCVITSEPAKTVSASYDDLRPLGCKCGADALIITDVKTENNRAIVTVSAVRYVAAPAPPAPAPKQ